MNDVPKEALGRAVRELRKDKDMTQEELGREADYGKGAGVSISRLEAGLLSPGEDRLARIAEALGVSVEELEARAREQAQARPAGARSPDRTTNSGTSTTAARKASPPTSKELKDRARRIQREVDRRTQVITDLTEEFNRQHDRARDEFFIRFVEVAERLDGGPAIDPTKLDGSDEGADDETSAPDAVATYRLKSNATHVQELLAGSVGGAAAGAAVGGAAAYGTFVAVATFGTASTGAAISGLSGVAATNATLAVLGGGTLAAGGAGVAGGTMVLAGIVAAPAFILAAGGLIWMAKRNRRQQLELAEQLQAAEDELAATKPGVDALEEVLPRVNETLGYIATHAGHALARWENRLGPDLRSWESLADAEKQRYRDFIDVAAAQVTLVTINVQGLLTTRGEEQEQLIEVAGEITAQCDDAVTARF